MKDNMKHPGALNLTGMAFIWAALLILTPLSGFGENTSEEKAVQTTTHARLAVEMAWDTYHHAALGGTLASPKIQSELEMKLHKSRALLAEAYAAEERSDKKATQELINEIIRITKIVITESQEPKQ